MVNTQPSPSAPPQAKVDLAPPDEPAANNGSVAIDLDSMPVTNAVPIVRDAKVGGIVIESAGSKSKSEDSSGKKRCTRKKVLLVSLAVLVIVGIGAGLAIALAPKSDDSARSSTANIKAHPLLPDCKVPNPSLVGDGMCNGGLYNTAECLWDAGDCIYYNTMYPNCHVPNPSLIGDGKCDGDEYSTEQCDWDGGDCPVAGDQDNTDVGATEPTTGPDIHPQGDTPVPTSGSGNTATPQDPQKDSVPFTQPDQPSEIYTTPTEPILPPPEPTCSMDEDLVVCDTSARDCGKWFIEHCDIHCKERACYRSEIVDSDVECVGQMACQGAKFRRSDVLCSKDGMMTCTSTKFFASAVKCEDGYFTCGDVMSTFFDPCTCCDGPDCPDGVPRCSGSGTQSFCSSKLLGKSCKEWGNPACDEISVTDSIPIHPSLSCSLGEEVAICNADRDCKRLQIDNCSTYCEDRSCQDTEFTSSTIECVQTMSCNRAKFRQSEVHCSSLEQMTCYGAEAEASVVTCEDGLNTCTGMSFDACSCCDGPDCPRGTPRCSGSGLQEFCSSTYLGKTCKEWGNPACNA